MYTSKHDSYARDACESTPRRAFDCDEVYWAYRFSVSPLKISAPAAEHVLVCAVDFGTTFSGYAFSSKNFPDDVQSQRHAGA